jgi:hypothetical protein
VSFSEEPRRDKAITAIISGSSQHNDLRAGRLMRRDRIGNRFAGALHERKAVHAPGNRQPVGLRHLVVGEDFDHAGAPYPKVGLHKYGTTRYGLPRAVDEFIGKVPSLAAKAFFEARKPRSNLTLLH